ncbi:MAG: transglutaminase family protein [Actinobacteria bacterium]|nr:transglutaminase family protein [Actinomycetota bacterium]MCG2801112.1 transglutaminase family protein [Cellulomonas sp.]
MTTRLRVVHTTSFRYAVPVAASYNEARMTPVSEAGQTVLSTRLTVQPQTWSTHYQDYWGTAVTVFEVLAPHQSLLITAEHLVEVADAGELIAPAGWDVLRSESVRDALAEDLSDTATTVVPDDVVALAVEAAGELGPQEAAAAICHALREQIRYIPGVTSVHTPAGEAWAARAGVCQDIAHLVVGALHSVGIPARYVSGYLHPVPDSAIGETVSGESHAWVEWWVGQWYAYDPTNSAPVGAHHVVLGRGRCYDDVAPLRGIYAGAGAAELKAQVQITREA